MVIPLVTLLCLNCRIFAAVTNKEIRSERTLHKDGIQLQIFQGISKLGQAEEGEQSLHHPRLHCHGLLLLSLTQVLPGILQGHYIPCLLEINSLILGSCHQQEFVLLNLGVDPVLPQVDAHYVFHQPPHAGAQQFNQLYHLLSCWIQVEFYKNKNLYKYKGCDSYL